MIDLDTYRAQCHEWLTRQHPPRLADTQDERSYAIFVAHDEDAERHHVDEARTWQAIRYDAGYGAIGWEPHWGGAGLSPAHERVYAATEQDFAVPARHELLEVTVGLVAPTVLACGTDEQREQFVRSFLRADRTCCQLFSEPGAGSDLAALGTRAVRRGEGWTADGQKVWTSGARFADWGFLIARTDLDAPKHRGLTAFLVRMDTPGIEIRPIRQMSGGSSFNEVFLTGVEIPDAQRLGDEGQGWKIALTLLGHERSTSAGVLGIGGHGTDLVQLAHALGMSTDPRVQERVGAALVRERAAALLGRLTAERQDIGREPTTAEGSLGKLVWSQNMTLIGDIAAEVLGPRLCADTGAPDAWAWTEHLLGAPGFRIAGGTDEIQRNIIGERGLGLPR